MKQGLFFSSNFRDYSYYLYRVMLIANLSNFIQLLNTFAFCFESISFVHSAFHNSNINEIRTMGRTPKYNIIISEATLKKVTSYKQGLLSRTIKPGAYLQNLLKNSSLEQMTNEQFIQLILRTKKPTIFAESEIRCDGTDWNRVELQILGDINIAMEVEIYDNGVWSTQNEKFSQHKPPMKGNLLFTPGPLLRGDSMDGVPPDYEELVTRGSVDQNKYNQLLDRRITPMLYHVNEKMKKENLSAVITIPGVGCGVFAGKFRGEMGEHLNAALQYIMRNNSENLTNVACLYYDPFDECKNEDHYARKYRVRPSLYNLDKSQLSDPIKFQEALDDFSKCVLFKVVAWDHVSFPGNDYFAGSRNTDDGVSAAATNSMEIITGVRGRYKNGYYLPPEGKHDWEQVVRENSISLIAEDNIYILTSEKLYIDLKEFEKRHTYVGII